MAENTQNTNQNPDQTSDQKAVNSSPEKATEGTNLLDDISVMIPQGST